MPAPAKAVCPICRRPTEPRFRPFCSERCANIDLGRWFGESYRIPAEPVPEQQDSEE
jgi:endogenous inhibitor of DNA gyrase (YacG/DUF329 family)